MLVEEGTDPAIRHRKNLAGLDELEIFGKIANEELHIHMHSSYHFIFKGQEKNRHSVSNNQSIWKIVISNDILYMIVSVRFTFLDKYQTSKIKNEKSDDV